MGELQGHVAKGAETVKEGELGPFCTVYHSYMGFLGGRSVCDRGHVPPFSNFVLTLLDFGVRVARQGVWNHGREKKKSVSSLLM